MNPKVVFVVNEHRPERQVAEVELHFPMIGGVLEGLKIVGFSLWRSPDSELYVTFPSRAFGAGSERRYFDFVRSVDGAGIEPVKRLKRWIVDEYHRQQTPARPPDPPGACACGSGLPHEECCRQGHPREVPR